MKKVLLLALTVLALSACVQPYEKPQEGEDYGVIKVNTQVEIDFVKHVKENKYELGLIEGELKELNWKYSDDLVQEGHHWRNTFSVRQDETIEKPVLKRLDNSENGVYNYVLLIPVDYAMQGGSYARYCGKGCVEEITTEMISDK